MEHFSIFTLMFARAVGVVTFLPMDVLPQGFALKLLFSLLLASVGYCNLEHPLNVDIADYPLQFMCGFVQALPILLLLQALEILGDLIEALRGQSLGAMLNPMSQTENAILPILLRSLMWVLMIQAGLLETIVVGIIKNINQSGFDLAFWKNNLDLVLKLLPLGFCTALVFAFLVLVVEICMGLSSKLLANFQLEHLGFFARSTICGLALLILLKTDFVFRFLKLYKLIVYE